MSTRKKSELESQRQREFGLLRQRVDGQVASAQEIMDALRQDLVRYRQENQLLAQKCNRLERTEASLDVARVELAEVSSKCQMSMAQNVRSQASLQALEEERNELLERCDDLEAALVHEGESSSMAQLEIRYLQEQVDHLESMVDLLMSQQELGDEE